MIIRFCKGMYNTPSAKAVREGWKEDRPYRIFMKTLFVIWVVSLSVSYYFYG